jgi:hypothetical protein
VVLDVDHFVKCLSSAAVRSPDGSGRICATKSSSGQGRLTDTGSIDLAHIGEQADRVRADQYLQRVGAGEGHSTSATSIDCEPFVGQYIAELPDDLTQPSMS